MILNLAFEQKTEAPIRPSAAFSRVVLICGKRGSGKSYTLGVIAEELARLDRFLVILVDPMGVFWSMGLPVTEQGSKGAEERRSRRAGQQGSAPAPLHPRTPAQFAVNILVPGDPAERYSPRALARMQELGVLFSRITLNPAALSAQAWCDLFDLSMSEPLGICLYRAVRACQKKRGGQGAREQESGNSKSAIRNPQFSIRDIMAEVESDGKAADRTREALINRLDMAEAWGVFAQACPEASAEPRAGGSGEAASAEAPGRRDADPSTGPSSRSGRGSGQRLESGLPCGIGTIPQGLKEDHINVLDLSIIDPGLHGLRNLILALLCRDLFARRIRARREEELGLIPLERRIWLLIDEAHQFVPTGRSSIAKDILIRWVKEGRQPGLSFVAVSQQPGAIDTDLLSQCDLLIIHKITAQEDLAAVSKLGQSYIRGDLKVYIKRLREPGEVIIVDDHEERLWMGRVRERETRHGGSELPLE